MKNEDDRPKQDAELRRQAEEDTRGNMAQSSEDRGSPWFA